MVKFKVLSLRTTQSEHVHRGSYHNLHARNLYQKFCGTQCSFVHVPVTETKSRTWKISHGCTGSIVTDSLQKLSTHVTPIADAACFSIPIPRVSCHVPGIFLLCVSVIVESPLGNQQKLFSWYHVFFSNYFVVEWHVSKIICIVTFSINIEDDSMTPI